MLGAKHDMTSIVTIETAENLHKIDVVVVVTDGKYIQLGEEERN